MLIRHDLKLVFLHVPKCAGKELRRVLSHGSAQGSLESLFNYDFCPVLGRYVDLAHLPLDDLHHRPEFSWLSSYNTVACVRNPYARLRSAASEYHRQRSKADEQTANANKLSRDQRWAYYRQLPARHSQQDPRFIHSQPMHRFTHLGEQPMVDYLLRCETLLSDLLALAESLQWPATLVDEANRSLRDAGSETTPWEPEELAVAHQLFERDFELFGYLRQPEPSDDTVWPSGWLKLQEQLQPESSEAAQLDLIHKAARVNWHWGPVACRPTHSTLRATRTNA
jgi:hypothetical protein